MAVPSDLEAVKNHAAGQHHPLSAATRLAAASKNHSTSTSAPTTVTTSSASISVSMQSTASLPSRPTLPPSTSSHHSTRSTHSNQSATASVSAPSPTLSLIESLMRDAHSGIDVSAHLPLLKRAILTDGLPADELGMSPHRIYIWLLLLKAPIMPYEDYARLLKRGASPVYAKISDDTHRTLATDPLFARRVSQNSISRLLNAVAWGLWDAEKVKEEEINHGKGFEEKVEGGPVGGGKQEAVDIGGDSVPEQANTTQPVIPDSKNNEDGSMLTAATTSISTSISTTTSTSNPQNDRPISKTPTPLPQSTSNPSAPSVPYVQGMNVLSAPFLYVSRSEPQAYSLLHTLLTVHLPSYIQPTMPGVHAGLSLVERLLSILDPTLAEHLTSHNLHPSVYAFPSVLTLSACTPPLPEVLVVWDFLFAWGVHLGVLAVVAQIVLCRDRLLKSDNLAREVRGLGPLRGRRVVELCVALVGRVPEGLWREMVEHTGV